MARLIARLSPGVATQAATQALLSVANVQDAQPVRTANAVIVVAPSDTLQQVRRDVAALPQVDQVFEDIQAVPLVASEEELQDFFGQLKERRPETELPPLIEGEPTGEDDMATDGGQGQGVALPDLSAEEQFPDELAGNIGSIDASIQFTGADAVHERGIQGESVICLNVDTGACDGMFADERQLSGKDLTDDADPFSDFMGHGSYTLGIMAGGPETKGIERGYAPRSDVYPIKTSLSSSELMQAQDVMVQLAEREGRPIIANNSWGFASCTNVCDHPIIDAVREAATHPMVTQVFAAGNGALKCGSNCGGTSIGINGPNSISEVLTVAATGDNGDPQALMPYSSRGGPSGVSCGGRKPDVAAPIHGRVPWACGSINIGDGGGTSGACPQVAGTVALMIDAAGDLSRKRQFSVIEETANQFQGSGFNGCTGNGNVMADAAVSQVEQPTAASFGGLVGAGLGAGVLGAVVRESVRRGR